MTEQESIRDAESAYEAREAVNREQRYDDGYGDGAVAEKGAA